MGGGRGYGGDSISPPLPYPKAPFAKFLFSRMKDSGLISFCLFFWNAAWGLQVLFWAASVALQFCRPVGYRSMVSSLANFFRQTGPNI